MYLSGDYAGISRLIYVRRRPFLSDPLELDRLVKHCQGQTRDFNPVRIALIQVY